MIGTRSDSDTTYSRAISSLPGILGLGLAKPFRPTATVSWFAIHISAPRQEQDCDPSIPAAGSRVTRYSHPAARPSWPGDWWGQAGTGLRSNRPRRGKLRCLMVSGSGGGIAPASRTGVAPMHGMSGLHAMPVRMSRHGTGISPIRTVMIAGS